MTTMKTGTEAKGEEKKKTAGGEIDGGMDGRQAGGVKLRSSCPFWRSTLAPGGHRAAVTLQSLSRWVFF